MGTNKIGLFLIDQHEGIWTMERVSILNKNKHQILNLSLHLSFIFCIVVNKVILYSIWGWSFSSESIELGCTIFVLGVYLIKH